MSREFAKNWFSTWTDEDFCTQPIFDKLLYQVLLGQPPTLLNHAGVQPLSLRRWRKAMRDGDSMPSEDEIMAGLERLEDRRYVYTDDDTCEVLVRSFIRRDQVSQQPTVLMSALRSAALVESPKIATILLAEITERIVLPEMKDSAYADKIRRAMKETLHNTVERLEALAERAPQDTDRPSTGDSRRPSIGPSTGGSTSPAETRPSHRPSTGGSNGPPVVVEVEVHSPSVVGYVGEERPHCAKHPEGNPNDDPCRGCQRTRTWDETHASTQQAAQALNERNTRIQTAQAKAAAIHDCPHCDQDGYRIPECRTVCDHTDRTQTNRNGITKARAALNGHTKTQTPHA